MIRVIFTDPRVESLTAEPNQDVVEYGQPLSLSCTISGSSSEVTRVLFIYVYQTDGYYYLVQPKQGKTYRWILLKKDRLNAVDKTVI